MPMYSSEDIIAVKKKQKRKQRLVKLAVILVVVILGGVLYATRDSWMPKLRGLGKQATTIINDGKLAEGNFPIEISGGGDYQLSGSDDMIFVLSDSSICIYNEEGGQLNRRQHTYTNAVMNTVNGRALLYENGGFNFSVEDVDGVLYKKETEDNILFVRLSEEGYTAVVTESDNYSCVMTVYDNKGKRIYERKCMERVNDICFTDESSGCVLSYIYAENGSLVTSVQDIKFTENSDKWESPGLDTMGTEVYSTSNGAFVLGFDACGYVDGAGQINSLFRYDGDLAGGGCENGKAVVVTNGKDTRRYIMTLFNGSGDSPISISFDSPLIDAEVFDGLAYVMTQDCIYAYDFTGKLRSTAQVNDSYTGFVRSDEYVFLKSFNTIDRIDYES